MNFDLDQLINLGIIDCLEKDVTFEEGTITKNDGTLVPYSISFGWNLIKALACDKEWKEYRTQILIHLKEDCDEQKRNELLTKIQFEDYHWKWFGKSLRHNQDEYKWFFLTTESAVQAACLIYFPKPSALDNSDIFYIDFIAVAPWNRFTPLEEKRFNGIGKKILQAIIKYLTTNLGYQYGFSLHSLPQAQGFYKHIGMVHFEQFDKVEAPDCDPLHYFEINHVNSMKFVGVA